MAGVVRLRERKVPSLCSHAETFISHFGEPSAFVMENAESTTVDASTVSEKLSVSTPLETLNTKLSSSGEAY